MAFKRALVVDDSRTARQSLAKLLAQYDLEVAFAETGEEALAFLNHELVDVIFMDHTMPGMDGLEAVSAIKGNPRTATIPVMMYTTKEGEVYVSQARALGAVGVLPKQVQPGVLFDMLRKLGLAADRRSGESTPELDAPKRRLTDLADDVDREYEQRALGVSVQAQVIRILEEQHLRLRSDILTSQRRFAQQVAADVLEQQRSGAGSDNTVAAGQPTPRSVRILAATAVTLAATLLAMGAFTWKVMAGRDAARLEVARMTTASRNELDALYQRNDGLANSMRGQHQATTLLRGTAIDALEWSLNQSTRVSFDALPFGDAAAVQLESLLPRLSDLGFQGEILLTARLAPFCLARDASGNLILASPEAPGDACETSGHPLENAGLAAMQSVGFAAALVDADRYPDIKVELAVRGPLESDLASSPNLETAGMWNRLAGDANRLQVSLLSNLAEADPSVSVSPGNAARRSAGVSPR